MKKLFCMLLSLLMVLSAGSMACAATAPEPETDTFALPPVIEPLGMVYINNNVSSDAVFESQFFTCVNGNGNSLRYWFQNEGSTRCTVQLFKKTILGLAYTQAPFTVAAGGQKSQVFNNPGNTTFKIKITADDGAVVKGMLRANQLDLASS